MLNYSVAELRLNIYIEGFYNCKNKEMKHNR